MAKATGFSHMTISRVLRAFGLQPHRCETFKLSPDAVLIPKVPDIVGLHLNPPGPSRPLRRRASAWGAPRRHTWRWCMAHAGLAGLSTQGLVTD